MLTSAFPNEPLRYGGTAPCTKSKKKLTLLILTWSYKQQKKKKVQKSTLNTDT